MFYMVEQFAKAEFLIQQMKQNFKPCRRCVSKPLQWPFFGHLIIYHGIKTSYTLFPFEYKRCDQGTNDRNVVDADVDVDVDSVAAAMHERVFCVGGAHVHD